MLRAGSSHTRHSTYVLATVLTSPINPTVRAFFYLKCPGLAYCSLILFLELAYLKSKESSVINSKLLCNKMQLNTLPINHGQLRTLTNADSGDTARTCLRPHPAGHPRHVPPAALCLHLPPLLTTRPVCAVYFLTVSDDLFQFPSSVLDLILLSSALPVSLSSRSFPPR